MIDRIVNQEVAWLAKQEAPVANAMVKTYQDAFQEIETKLASIKNFNSYSAKQLRASQAQFAAIIENMQQNHSQLLGPHVKEIYKTKLASQVKTWANLEATFGDPGVAKQFADIKPTINQRAVRSLLTVQNVSIKGFSSDLQREVRNRIALGHAKGETIDQIVRRLRQVPNLPQCSPNRLRLIVRMETARATNKAKVDHIKELQREFPDRQYWLMVKDSLSRTPKTRNHWFSFAIHGCVRNVTKGEWYEVSTAMMNAAKSEYKGITGRKPSDNGVLWKPGGSGRRGKGLPAHFWDRGVEVPWDPAWQGAAFGQVKHPQGPINEVVKPPEEIKPPEVVNPPKPKATRAPKAQKAPKPAKETELKSFRGLAGEQVRDELAKIMKLNGEKIKEIKLQMSVLDKASTLRLEEGDLPGFRDTIAEMARLNKSILKSTEKVKKKAFEKMLAENVEPINIEFRNIRPKVNFKRDVEKGVAIFSAMTGGKHAGKPPVKFFGMKGRRAGFSKPLNMITSSFKPGIETIIHELGHWLEDNNPKIHQAAIDLYLNRTKNDEYERLIDIFPRSNYRADEWIKKDDFKQLYLGKVYYQKPGGGLSTREAYPGQEIDATEIISMGLQYMYEDPFQLAEDYPDLFDLIWEAMNDG